MVTFKHWGDRICAGEGVVEVGVVEGEGPGEAEVVLVGYGEVGYSCAGIPNFGVGRWALHSAPRRVGEVVSVLGYQPVTQPRPGEKVDGDRVLEGGLRLYGTLPDGHEGEVGRVGVEEILMSVSFCLVLLSEKRYGIERRTEERGYLHKQV